MRCRCRRSFPVGHAMQLPMMLLFAEEFARERVGWFGGHPFERSAQRELYLTPLLVLWTFPTVAIAGSAPTAACAALGSNRSPCCCSNSLFCEFSDSPAREAA